MVMRLVDRCIEGNSSSSGSSSFSRQASAAAAAAAGDGLDVDAEDDEAWGVEVTEEDRAVWAAQEALVDRLPKVRPASFRVYVVSNRCGVCYATCCSSQAVVTALRRCTISVHVGVATRTVTHEPALPAVFCGGVGCTGGPG
jgi:hypothetical protein